MENTSLKNTLNSLREAAKNIDAIEELNDFEKEQLKYFLDQLEISKIKLNGKLNIKI